MVRIKVVMLDADETYAGRLVNAFNTNYQDKLEVFYFTEKKIALEFLQSKRIDVFLSDESIEIDTKELPSKCAFAYLTTMGSVDSIYGSKAICKFQKVDLIYKEILSVFSEATEYTMALGSGKSDKRPVTGFISMAGGTGSSSVAMAYAVKQAKSGGQPLFLNLELLGSTDSYFDSDGNLTMSDVIYSLKSKKANIALKIESAVRVSSHGVSYIASSPLMLDMMEMTEENILTLINEARAMANYDEIILDLDFNMQGIDLELIRQSDRVIVVTDGSDVANEKTTRCIEALRIMEEQKDENLCGKLSIFYNKFSNRYGKRLADGNLTTIGGAPRIDGTFRQIIDALSANNDIAKI